MIRVFISFASFSNKASILRFYALFALILHTENYQDMTTLPLLAMRMILPPEICPFLKKKNYNRYRWSTCHYYHGNSDFGRTIYTLASCWNDPDIVRNILGVKKIIIFNLSQSIPIFTRATYTNFTRLSNQS